jgi:hypothetical protein
MKAQIQNESRKRQSLIIQGCLLDKPLAKAVLPLVTFH